jgi:membrane protein
MACALLGQAVKALRAIWMLLRDTVSSWLDDGAPSMGAALAYYTLFSIAPLLLIVIALAGAAFGDEVARGGVISELRALMGPEGARAVEALLLSTYREGHSLPATVGGMLVLLAGATTVFAELQSAMDRIWRVAAPTADANLWQWLRKRLLSLGLILGIGFLLMVSLVASAALTAVTRWWSPLFGQAQVIAQGFDFAFSLCLITFAFAMIYKWMPRVRLRWHDVWIGAGVTALLFTVGKQLIGTYLGSSGVTSGFGAAASLVAMVVWVYYSVQIFLLGVEFTWVYARRFGSRRAIDGGGAEGGSPTGGVAGRGGS